MTFRRPAFLILMAMAVFSVKAQAASAICEIEKISAVNLRDGDIVSLFSDQKETNSNSGLHFGPGRMTVNFQEEALFSKVVVYGCNARPLTGGVQVSTNIMPLKNDYLPGGISSAADAMEFAIPDTEDTPRVEVEHIVFDFTQPDTCISRIEFRIGDSGADACLTNLSEGQ